MSTTLRYDTKPISGQMPKLIRTSTPSPPQLSRRQPFLRRSLSTPSPTTSSCTGGATAAEFCGGTTASCAAVWCCAPCGIGKLIVLAVYKVPAGICRRAIRHRRRRRLVKSGLLPPPPPPQPKPEIERSHRRRSRFGSSELAVHPLESREVSEEDDEDDDGDFLELKVLGRSSTVATMFSAEEEEDAAVIALEKEMWNRFYGAGFWRSPSQRETVSSPRFAVAGVLQTTAETATER